MGRRVGRVQHSRAGFVVGVALCVLGLAVIAVAWSGTTAEPLLEVPFLFPLAGGFTGLGLVVVGAAVAVIDALRRDARVRGLELGRLTATLAALREELAREGAPTGALGPPGRAATPVRSQAGQSDDTVEIRAAREGSTDRPAS